MGASVYAVLILGREMSDEEVYAEDPHGKLKLKPPIDAYVKAAEQHEDGWNTDVPTFVDVAEESEPRTFFGYAWRVELEDEEPCVVNPHDLAGVSGKTNRVMSRLRAMGLSDADVRLHVLIDVA